MTKKPLLDEPRPRRFQLYRREDVNGGSGTGIVAEGIEHRDGSVQYHWLTSPTTWQMAQSIGDIQHIHGHNGRTTVRWLDDEQHAPKEKSLAQVYEERNRLALALATMAGELARFHDAMGVPPRFKGYAGGWHEPTDEDDADPEDWAVTWADLPTGQVSWHVPRELVDLAALEREPLDYDGHDRDEKNDRLLDYATTDW